jgi:hypothetical protein
MTIPHMSTGFALPCEGRSVPLVWIAIGIPANNHMRVERLGRSGRYWQALNVRDHNRQWCLPPRQAGLGGIDFRSPLVVSLSDFPGAAQYAYLYRPVID